MQSKSKLFYSLKDYIYTQDVIKSHYPWRYWFTNKNLFLHLNFLLLFIWLLISIFSIFIPVSNRYGIGHGVIIAFESAFQYVVKIISNKNPSDPQNLSPVFWNYEAYSFLYLTIVVVIVSLYCWRLLSRFFVKFKGFSVENKGVLSKISAMEKWFKFCTIFSIVLVSWTSFALLYLNKPLVDAIGTILFKSQVASEKVYHRQFTNVGWATAILNLSWFVCIVLMYVKYCRELFNGNSFFLKELRFKTVSDTEIIFNANVQKSIDDSLNIREKQNFQVKNTRGYIAELSGVNKYFNVGKGQFHALKDVNLKIKSGDFIVILGYSGSGKTTLLNILAGIDRPTTGTCVISDNNTSLMRDKDLNWFRRKKIGYIFQNYALLPNLNASENIGITQNMDAPSLRNRLNKLRELLASERHSTHREKLMIIFNFVKATFLSKGGKEELDFLMNYLNLSEHKYKFPHQLSGGQQQRVSITRALIKKPSILLADEPTGAIDHSMTKSILELFYDINRYAKTTVILITHNPLIARMAKRILYVEDGWIVKDVLNEKPQHPQEIKGL